MKLKQKIVREDKENKRRLYDQKCEMVFGFIRTRVGEENTMTIPLQVKNICRMYYYKLKWQELGFEPPCDALVSNQ